MAYRIEIRGRSRGKEVASWSESDGVPTFHTFDLALDVARALARRCDFAVRVSGDDGEFVEVSPQRPPPSRGPRAPNRKRKVPETL